MSELSELCRLSELRKLSKLSEFCRWCELPLLEAGGGRNPPPLSYFCDSPKKINGKSCQIFFTFPKYVNGVVETTFCSHMTFGLSGRWQKWSKLPYFRKGGPCREKNECKIHDTDKCRLRHVSHNFLVLFVL